MMQRAPATADDDFVDFVDRLFAWFQEAGSSRYDEEVTQAEHALQTAHLARQADAPRALVIAALFHDIGHLLVGEHRSRDDFLLNDDRHEIVGAHWLSSLFDEAVAAPVRLHVPAKRWLCTRDSGYAARLSPASTRSLALQGGQMTADEAAAFEDQAHWHDAVALRRWDEAAKVRERSVPGFGDYRESVLRLLLVQDSLPPT